MFRSTVIVIYLLIGFPTVSFGFSYVAGKIPVHEHLNLSYGEHPDHLLDVVTSPKCEQSAVVIFVHGGSWRWGKKDYHRTIGRQLARRGILFVTVNYRLFPKVRFPVFPQDIVKSVKWVIENVVKFGGDPGKIFLMGHSAGAHSVSLVGLDSQYLKKHGGNLKWIRGVIPIACPFLFEPSKEFLYRELFPEGIELDRLMPMNLAKAENSPPFLIMHGLFDPLIPKEQAFEFARKIIGAGGSAKVRLYSSHGHFSLIRRTTSWHIWPQPLLRDLISFINSES